MPEQPRLRPARPQDRRALFEICLKTAAHGADASTLYSDPDYPGLVWSVPYLEFAPAHCFVVDLAGTAVGFVVGAPDTIAFERRLDRDWWPGLRERYAGRQPVAPLDHRVLDHIRSPEQSTGEIVTAYPAHLHINLLPPVQAGGWGRKLIEAELDSLRAAGVPAVHLGVSRFNPRAIGFYEHVGFTRLAAEGDGIIYGMQL
jgi:ribosomal protein S18 acetylase RimI-like enzyme